MRRKYEYKLARRVMASRENKDFLLAHLKEEWEALERTIENDRRKRKLYTIVQQTGTALGFTILGMAAVCGVLFVGAVAPNIFSAFGRLGRHRRYFNKRHFRERVYYFQRRGYIRVERSRSDGLRIALTRLGQEHVIKHTVGTLKIMSQEQWDGIWRIVIFDIPERNKWAREGIRTCLKCMGFYRLQKSIFVFPYPCRNEVGFLTRIYDVRGAVRFLETASLDIDEDIKQFFALTS